MTDTKKDRRICEKSMRLHFEEHMVSLSVHDNDTCCNHEASAQLLNGCKHPDSCIFCVKVRVKEKYVSRTLF